MKFKVYDELFNRIPDAVFGVVVALNIDNTRPISEISSFLENETALLKEKLFGKEVKECEDILPYRNAFKLLGINPNKYMSSIEAMAKRVSKGSSLPSINPAVDLGNAISLKYMLPIGAHDMDALDEDIAIRFARQGDVFTPLGCAEQEDVDEGELVYADGKRVRTRRWIWRQSDRGKITETSRNIFFPIDGFTLSNGSKVVNAADELSFLLQKYFNCEIKEYFVDSVNNEIELFDSN